MRVLGFERKWPKLRNPLFTTFRYQRRDRDYEVDEVLQIVVKPRSKNREYIGNAEIVAKQSILINEISEDEAKTDGFIDLADMQKWLANTYGNDDRFTFNQPMNKLVLKWKGVKK